LSDVVVIVAARNEARHLLPCLESLLTAAKGEAEIIIVDDSSTDESPEILRSFTPRIRIVQGEGRGPGRARNLALAASSRPWVAFTDADCIVPKEWLTTLKNGIRACPDSVSSIGGGQAVSSLAGAAERLIGEFFQAAGFVSNYIHEGSLRTVLHNPTCNVLYRRRALEAAGGFDESLWPCEDLDLDLRLKKTGFRALYQPGVFVEHRRPESFSALGGMMRRYGFAHAQLAKKHGPCQHLHLLALTPLLAVGIGACFRSWIPGYLVLGAFLFGLSFSLFLVRSRRFSKALIFTFLTGIAVPSWVFGFYCGLMGSRRIAQHA
jgi:glycosyltransferase involved in cell wall biosynthesis